MEGPGTNPIQIVVNGEAREAPPGLSVARLLDLLAVNPSRVAVELNHSIVRKQDWDTTVVSNGARLEIVWFVGGG